MSGVEFPGGQSSGRLEDLDRALLIGHPLAQPLDLRELLSRRTFQSIDALADAVASLQADV